MRVVIVIKIDFRYIGTREHCNAARKFPTSSYTTTTMSVDNSDAARRPPYSGSYYSLPLPWCKQGSYVIICKYYSFNHPRHALLPFRLHSCTEAALARDRIQNVIESIHSHLDDNRRRELSVMRASYLQFQVPHGSCLQWVFARPRICALSTGKEMVIKRSQWASLRLIGTVSKADTDVRYHFCYIDTYLIQVVLDVQPESCCPGK